MKIVIALIGAKGAGKTTAFNAISSVMDVQEITLASKLKDTCSEVFNVPRNAFDSHKLKEKELDDLVSLTPDNLEKIFKAYDIKADYDKFIRPHVGKVLISPRQIAQYVGTEVLRNYEVDIHCNSAVKNVQKRVGVVTDMRFPNEFDYFNKNYTGFFPVYIRNVGAEIAAQGDTHASEAYLRDLSNRAVITIQNNSSISEFSVKVVDFLKGVT